jgi:hypothetical protein
MPSPFDHSPRPPRNAPTPAVESLQRSQERREQERRLWVARSLRRMILLGIVLLGVIVVRRDRSTRSRFVDSLERYVTVLNAKLDKQRRDGWDHLMLPAEWDVKDIQPKPSIPFEFYRYCNDTLRQFAQSRKEPTLIAWNKESIKMTITSDGRAVAIYDNGGDPRGGRVHVEWLSEREFNRRFDEQQEQLEQAVREAERAPVRIP